MLFAAAPARRDAPTGDVAFVFRRNLYLSGNGTMPYSIELDFGDGRGYQAATWGQPLRTTYTSAGTKQVKVRLIYITGFFRRETRESWFDFTVQGVASASLSRYAAGNDLEYIVPITSAHASAHISVRYGAGHTALVKPLIVVEQYNLATVSDGKLEHCNNANNTVFSFLDRIQSPFTTPFDFDDHLEQAGYDIVYIDFDRNTDDIRRNAALFEDVVRWVNDQKQPLNGVRQPNVVLAMSMGGLIARYGLAEMTKLPPAPSGGRNLNDPETRLLALHDSPQRGAYNPIGVQSLTRSFGVPFLFNLRVLDFKDELRAAVDVLDEPATQQLSILNAFNGRGGSGIQANTFLNGPGSPYRQMIDNVPGAAYTIVATSDGSQCGQPQNTPLGVLLSSTSRNHFLFPSVGVFIYNLTLQTDMAAFGLPAYGQQAEVSHARIWIQYDLCIGTSYFGYCFPIKFYLLRESATSPANTLPYETLPGGNTNYKRESGKCAELDAITSFFLNVTLYDGDVCFVPTFSALDLPSTTPATAYAKYINNLTDNPTQRVGNPAIGRFIAQEQSGSQFSLTHLRYTARNSEWLFNEFQRPYAAPGTNPNPLACQNNPQECSVPTLITGPGTLCGTATYATSVQGPGLTYTWTASPGSAFTVSSGSDPTFTTSNAGSSSDYGTLTLQIGGDCPLTLTKQVKLGAPETPGIGALDTFDGCTYQFATFQIFNYDPTLTYQLSASGSISLRSSLRADGTFNVKGGGRGGAITITASNGCGTTTIRNDFTFEPCSNFAVYPNPGADEVTVQQDNTTTPTPSARGTATDAPSARAAAADPSPGIEAVRLYDSYGKLRLEQAGHGARAVRLRVGALPAGFYVLHIVQEGAVVSRQRLEVAH